MRTLVFSSILSISLMDNTNAELLKKLLSRDRGRAGGCRAIRPTRALCTAQIARDRALSALLRGATLCG